jgi:hypothetical protein
MEAVAGLLILVAIAMGIARLVSSNNSPQKKGGTNMVQKRYRVNGKDNYTIRYERQSNGTFRIMCTEHPYNAHSTSVTKCHLFSNGEVCVTGGKEPRTLDRAVAIAQVWMEGYSRYVRTGKFPTGRKRVNV